MAGLSYSKAAKLSEEIPVTPNVGRYEVSGDNFTAELDIIQFNDEMGDVFGLNSSEFAVTVNLTRSDNLMKGTMVVPEQIGVSLPLILQRFRDLP